MRTAKHGGGGAVGGGADGRVFSPSLGSKVSNLQADRVRQFVNCSSDLRTHLVKKKKKKKSVYVRLVSNQSRVSMGN